MRKFSSYGPIEPKNEYYVPRTELIQYAYTQLVGEHEDEGGHYITVWAPRQSGKTWVLQQAISQIKQKSEFEVVSLDMQPAKNETTDESILDYFVTRLEKAIGRSLPEISNWKSLDQIFTKEYFPRPLILVIDEFDSLKENFINNFANVFRAIHISRKNQPNLKTHEKDHMLHGLALIGVRSVLGIENDSGSPFNVQRSVKIPNLTDDEVRSLFNCYEKESGQNIEPQVVDKIIYEFRGQPGLTCWFGELLTEQYNETPNKPIDMNNLNSVYAMALNVLPNNNILNIISKVKISPYKEQVLELFRTEGKTYFTFNNPMFTYLYMVGVIDYEQQGNEFYVKFHAPFIQKSLFNYFSNELFSYMGGLTDPFIDIDKIIAPQYLDIKELIKLYEIYLKKNRDWLLKKAPRRDDLRIYEAIFHFNFYMFLFRLLSPYAEIFPEFPTGNGKIDIIIKYQNKTYPLELKSFSNKKGYDSAIDQAANYAVQLNLTEITLVFFVESVDDGSRKKYEQPHFDNKTGITVDPVFVEIG